MKSSCICLFAGAVVCALILQLPAAEAARFREKVLHSFGSGADGSVPFASVIDVSGTLYGTTFGGGTHGAGTVFALDPTAGVETVLYSFCSRKDCADGQGPDAGL